MREDPLVLYCNPRGGSSLVTGIFKRHGFWTGRTYGMNKGGTVQRAYPSHENVQLRDFMKHFWPLKAGNHNNNPKNKNLREYCGKVTKHDDIWLFKGLSEYFPVWNHWFPESTSVFIFRDYEQAVATHVRRGPNHPENSPAAQAFEENVRRIITARYDFMEARLADTPNSFRVDADRVVDGDCGQLEPILAQYDLVLDHRLAMEGISPDLFHKRDSAGVPA